MSITCGDCCNEKNTAGCAGCLGAGNTSNFRPKTMFTPQDLLQASAVIYAGYCANNGPGSFTAFDSYTHVKELAKLIEEDFNK